MSPASAAPPAGGPTREAQPLVATKAPAATPAVTDSKSPATATAWQERDWCEGKDVVAPDLKIGGCTAVIQSGRATAELLAEAFNNRGTAYADKREYDTAILDFSQAIRLKSDDAGFLDNRGYAYQQRQDFDHAIADFNAALQINPKAASSLYGRGLARLKTGDSSGGNADIAAAKEIEPDIARQLARYGVK